MPNWDESIKWWDKTVKASNAFYVGMLRAELETRTMAWGWERPFGGKCEYPDFKACVDDNQDKDDPEAYCGELQKKTEEACREMVRVEMAAAKQTWKYNVRRHQWRIPYGPRRGRFASTREIDALFRGVQGVVGQELVSLADALIAGSSNANIFMEGFQATLQRGHASAHLTGIGGMHHLHSYSAVMVDEVVAYQMELVDALHARFAAGEISAAQFRSRSAMYARAAMRTTVYDTRTRMLRDDGWALAQRILGHGRNCTGCMDEAWEGWKPIDQMTPIGGHECNGNCNCHFEYRYSRDHAYPLTSVGEPDW